MKITAVRFGDMREGHTMYAARIGAAISAFGRSNTPKAHSASAAACPATRTFMRRSAAAKAVVAASSHVVANSTSRQIIPTKTKAGGIKANSGTNRAIARERGAIASASTPKAAQ